MLMEHMAARGVPCPVPLKDRKGQAIQTLCGKLAALVTFLDGASPDPITNGHCRLTGEGLARFHRAGRDFSPYRANTLGIDVWRRTFAQCLDVVSQLRLGLDSEIAEELDVLERGWPRDLPVGTIHGDLFSDNVFFSKGSLSGIIDLYFACDDLLAYDLAVCLNAWCFNDSGVFDLGKARAIFTGYTSIRPMESEEVRALPILLRGGAMRFLLTRLFDWDHTPNVPLTRRKDPLEYWRKIGFHRANRDVHNSFTDLG